VAAMVSHAEDPRLISSISIRKTPQVESPAAFPMLFHQ